MFQMLRNSVQSLARDERGLTTVEYAIVLCLIAAAAVGAWNKFGQTITNSLKASDGEINTYLGASSKSDG